VILIRLVVSAGIAVAAGGAAAGYGLTQKSAQLTAAAAANHDTKLHAAESTFLALAIAVFLVLFVVSTLVSRWRRNRKEDRYQQAQQTRPVRRAEEGW
jgi:heme/copper-type cytochrome/quinol oxidase subunit 2